MGQQFRKIVEEIGDMAMRGKEKTMREHMSLNLKEFANKVAAFNKLGESLYGSSNFSRLAEELEEIATHAEAYTLRETEEAPFDQITIKRNMKELRGYTSEFKKVASEARSLQERMTALYEDSGRVLGRYFEIKEMGQPDGMGELQPKSEEEKIVNAHAGIREIQEDCPCHNTADCTCGEDCACGKGHCDCGFDEGVVNEGNKCSVCGKPSKENTDGNPKYCQGHSQSEMQKLKKDVPLKKEGIVNESMKLMHLMREDVNDDRPKDDWMVLDVPKLRYDAAKEFEKDLKKKFTVRRFDWKERTGGGQEFAEFYVHKKDYDEANKYAVGIYQSYANNSGTEKE